jgi:hypothetical protein
MIQSALENKYGFHMQVSARAISARGVATRSRKRLKNAAGGAEGRYISTHAHDNVLSNRPMASFVSY